MERIGSPIMVPDPFCLGYPLFYACLGLYATATIITLHWADRNSLVAVMRVG